MLLTLMREPSHELGRCRSLWRLRCAHVGHDGRSLVRHPCAEAGRLQIGPAAIRLASGSVRVWPLHHRSLVLVPDCRAEFVMTVADVTTKRGETPVDREVSPPPPPETCAAAERRASVVPFLITLGTVVLAGFLGWGLWRVYMGSPW